MLIAQNIIAGMFSWNEMKSRFIVKSMTENRNGT